MGIVHAIQKGDMPASRAKGKAKDVAQTMNPQDVTDFASTKHKGLPGRAKKSGADARSVLRMAYALLQ